MKLSPLFQLATAATLAATLAAGAVQAQTTDAAPKLDLRLAGLAQTDIATAPVARPVGVAPRPTPDLANPLDPFAPTKLVVNPLESAVFATTAVDHRFDRADKVTGSVGFLCGLQPSHAEAGGAGAAYGVDPHGRFVGAKLAFAF
ncbi:MAG TPA: hypothetical protein VFE18_13290 [Phenylobacterium sp.]|uniref:hypothetical protein n=1 Tax=Phenylobacterium sp. TaxID=1871053 RepID=UPI002D426E28|nr:hypothetical protein [Phenylobacterium sp.]HZZ69141.1 hypothetical protein [Phenylobacterium sp.]